jgi:uncharacterized protein
MPEEPGEPLLGKEEARGLRQGVTQFNAGLFFECHDTLEDVWTGIRGPARDFFQGLIQISVGFYHLGNGNRGGAATMLRRGLERLAGYGTPYCGLELDPLREEVGAWLRRVEAGEEVAAPLRDLPKYRLRPATKPAP